MSGVGLEWVTEFGKGVHGSNRKAKRSVADHGPRLVEHAMSFHLARLLEPSIDTKALQVNFGVDRMALVTAAGCDSGRRRR